ncbi:YgfZ/GcvT domain-containing protein [Emcibacter nanhaiensis]|uniref:Folate-binding protein YgfZ n=1 Tax=Emcibacter nanhaiensis TaxID=1505037 RepID=A0A501PBV4_9PROT|nr:folate-binding protein YgfZ [Emcibacter nanhaiensis]TPD57571.1 folate-binding protein YgfZ [Emcibacter nanhaiensis]
MTTALYHLENRQVFSLTGKDRLTFLQGLITSNVRRISDGGALYAALLTPQGKYLFDFFLYAAADVVYLDCEKDRAAELLRKLMMYKLRAEVEISDETDRLKILSLDSPLEGTLACFQDPRLPALGYRAVVEDLPEDCLSPGKADYDRKRLALGIAEGADDFIIDKSLALEGNMEELHGVDFDKGCYVGQEITARTKHRGKIRRRFVPVTVSGPLPAPDSPVLNREGQEIGILRSGIDKRAMAYVKLEKLDFSQSYTCGQAEVTPWKPDWMKVEEHVDAN